MKYIIVTVQGSYIESTALKLEAKVQTRILDGWVPLGGVNSSYRHGASVYTLQQAMIKEGKLNV